MGKTKKYVWRQVPLFRILWPFITGVSCGLYCQDDHHAFQALIASLSLSPSLFFLKGPWRSLILSILIALSAFSISAIRSSYADCLNPVDRFDEAVYMMEISERPVRRGRYLKTSGYILGDTTNRGCSNSKIDLFLEFDTACGLGVGDIVLTTCDPQLIRAPQNPGMFDYRHFMAVKGVSYQSFVDSADWKLIKKGRGIFSWVDGLNLKARTYIIDGGSNDASSILAALILGDKSSLSANQKSAFAKAGAMHVLAVSGLHVGIFYLFLLAILKPLSRSRLTKLVRSTLILAVLWGFAAITGFSPSVVRSSAMFSFMILADLFERKSGGLNSVFASAVLMLILNPDYLLQVGFQLSYVAVVGIIVLQPRIYHVWSPRWIVLDKLWSLTAVSIAAQIATFPLAIYYFNQFPNYFLVSNWIVIPAVSVILPAGLLLIVVGWIPHFGELYRTGLYWALEKLQWVIETISQLPFSVLSQLEISTYELILIYALILTSALFFVHRKATYALVSVALLIGLQMSRLNESFIERSRREIIFYSSSGMNILDMIEGRSVHSWSTSKDDASFAYNVQPYRSLMNANLEEAELLSGLTNVSGKMVLSPGDSLEILDTLDEVDVLWIIERTMQRPAEILALTQPKLVLLSRNLDWRSRQYWRRESEGAGVEYYDQYANGAFIYSLE